MGLSKSRLDLIALLNAKLGSWQRALLKSMASIMKRPLQELLMSHLFTFLLSLPPLDIGIFFSCM